MKKILIALMMIFLLCGCRNVPYTEDEINNIKDYIINTKIKCDDMYSSLSLKIDERDEEYSRNENSYWYKINGENRDFKYNDGNVSVTVDDELVETFAMSYDDFVNKYGAFYVTLSDFNYSKIKTRIVGKSEYYEFTMPNSTCNVVVPSLKNDEEIILTGLRLIFRADSSSNLNRSYLTIYGYYNGAPQTIEIY